MIKLVFDQILGNQQHSVVLESRAPKINWRSQILPELSITITRDDLILVLNDTTTVSAGDPVTGNIGCANHEDVVLDISLKNHLNAANFAPAMRAVVVQPSDDNSVMVDSKPKLWGDNSMESKEWI